MKLVELKRVFKNWWQIAICDSWALTFGFPTVFSVLVVPGLKKLEILPSGGEIWNNMYSTIASFLIALVVCSIPALSKAYKILRPLVLTIADDIRSPVLDSDSPHRRHNVMVVVENRSGIHLKDCVAYLMNISRGDGTSGARQVEQFDLPPKCQKNVAIAYWDSREAPYSDDKGINLHGPYAAGYGGNRIILPGPEEILHVKVCMQNNDSKDLSCRVWIDETSRSLRGQKLVD